MADKDWRRSQLAWLLLAGIAVGTMDGCCSRWPPGRFGHERMVGKERVLARRTRQCLLAWVPTGHSWSLGSFVGKLTASMMMIACAQTWPGRMRNHRLGCRMVDRMVVRLELSCRSSLLPMRLMVGCRVRRNHAEVLVPGIVAQFDDRLERALEEVIRKCRPKILVDSIVDDNEWCCLVPFGRVPYANKN